MITLIFGAGASFGSGPCEPFNPPLGMDLFARLEERGGAFSRLDAHIKEIFITQGFESGMSAIEDVNTAINPLQKEIAIYLSQFMPQHENAYIRLFNKLKSSYKNISVATLNYDLLIEHALLFTRIPFSYGRSTGLHLLKPHGSSNFLPNLGSMVLQGNVFAGCGSFVDGLPIDTPFSHQEVESWCINPKNSDISPALSMYAPTKRVVMNRSLIESIQQEFSKIITDSNLIVVIGVGLAEHDQHIWDPIKKSKGRLLIVDLYPEKLIHWANKHEIANSHIKGGFKENIWTITKEVHKYC